MFGLKVDRDFGEIDVGMSEIVQEIRQRHDRHVANDFHQFSIGQARRASRFKLFVGDIAASLKNVLSQREHGLGFLIARNPLTG